eukprot:PhF_6_TR4764/c0_g1_i1/m.6575
MTSSVAATSTSYSTLPECHKFSGLCFDHGNPIYKHVTSAPFIIFAHVSYISLIILLTKIRFRVPYIPTTAIFNAFFFFQAAVSFVLVIKLFPNIPWGNVVDVLRTPFSNTIEYWILFYTLTRYLDWLLLVIRAFTSSFISFPEMFSQFATTLVWGLLLWSGLGNGAIYMFVFLGSLSRALSCSGLLLKKFFGFPFLSDMTRHLWRTVVIMCMVYCVVLFMFTPFPKVWLGLLFLYYGITLTFQLNLLG